MKLSQDVAFPEVPGFSRTIVKRPSEANRLVTKAAVLVGGREVDDQAVRVHGPRHVHRVDLDVELPVAGSRRGPIGMGVDVGRPRTSGRMSPTGNRACGRPWQPTNTHSRAIDGSNSLSSSLSPTNSRAVLPSQAPASGVLGALGAGAPSVANRPLQAMAGQPACEEAKSNANPRPVRAKKKKRLAPPTPPELPATSASRFARPRTASLHSRLPECNASFLNNAASVRETDCEWGNNAAEFEQPRPT
jgi:hypothetical protein